MRIASRHHCDFLIRPLLFLLFGLLSTSPATADAYYRDVTKPADARITAEDTLHLIVKVGAKTLIDEHLRVSEKGTIYLPDIGRHTVLGLTPAQAVHDIIPRYDTPSLYPSAVITLSYAPTYRNTKLDR